MRPLSYQDREIGKIYAEADIGSLLQERSDVFRTLLLTNLLLTLLLATVGYLAIRRMIRPVRIDVILSRSGEPGQNRTHP